MRQAAAAKPSLSELQSELVRVWTNPAGIDAGLKGSGVAKFIVEAPPLSARDRLAVYYDAYFSRLLEALGSDFSATKRALGEEHFRRLVAEFLAKRRSDSPNLTDLGRRLPEFSKGRALAKRFPYLYDLCRLEWEVLAALYTDRLPPLDRAQLSGVDWEKAALVFDPTLRLLDVSWPVDRLWAQRDKPAKAARCVWRTPRPATLAVWRDEEWVRVESLDVDAAEILQSLVAGGKLSKSFASSKAKPDRIQAWFSEWAQNGMIKGVKR